MDTVNAVWEGHTRATFYVHFENSGCHAHVADQRDVRALLQRALHRSRLSRAGGWLGRERRAKHCPAVRPAPALTMPALCPRPECTECHTLVSLPEQSFTLPYGQTLQELQDQAAADERSDGFGSGRSRSSRSHFAAEVFHGSDSSWESAEE